jgi:hypothetical protein
MKGLPSLLFVALLAFTLPSRGQGIVKCSSGKTFWYISENCINYAVPLSGDIAQGNRTNLINVEDKALEYSVTCKEEFEKQGSSDNLVLIQFGAAQTTHLRDIYKPPFDVQMKYSTLTSGQAVLLWYYKLPEGASRQVETQLFVDVVIDDAIFGLGSPQFHGQDFDDIKDFLMKAIATIQIVENKECLCYE